MSAMDLILGSSYLATVRHALDEEMIMTPEKVSLGWMLNHPPVGPTQSQILEGVVDGNPILYLGAGSEGVLRRFWMCTNIPLDWGDFKKFRLRVYVGAGNVAGPATAAIASQYLMIDLPFASVVGQVFLGDQPGNPVSLDTQHFMACCPTLAVGAYMAVLEFAFPILFQNGVVIQIGILDGATWTPLSPNGGDPVQQTWSYAWFELGTLPLAGFRLKSGMCSGSRSHPNDLVFLNEASGIGFPVFMFAALAGDTPALENNWTFETDRTAHAQCKTSGTEDLFGADEAGYFSGGVKQTRIWGVYRVSVVEGPGGQMEVEAYRTFDDSPVRWTNGGWGFLPVDEVNAITNSQIVLLYYQQVAA